jgi:hypothetical protein
MNQNQVPIKSTCNACGGEGVLGTSKTFTLAGREHTLLSSQPPRKSRVAVLYKVALHIFYLHVKMLPKMSVITS